MAQFEESTFLWTKDQSWPYKCFHTAVLSQKQRQLRSILTQVMAQHTTLVNILQTLVTDTRCISNDTGLLNSHFTFITNVIMQYNNALMCLKLFIQYMLCSLLLIWSDAMSLLAVISCATYLDLQWWRLVVHGHSLSLRVRVWLWGGGSCWILQRQIQHVRSHFTLSNSYKYILHQYMLCFGDLCCISAALLIYFQLTWAMLSSNTLNNQRAQSTPNKKKTSDSWISL